MQNKPSSKAPRRAPVRQGEPSGARAGAAQRTGPATRDRILNAARTIYARRNYRNVRTADISAASGANVALVNYYFGSKDSLFLEIFRQSCEDAARARAHSLEGLLQAHPAPDMATVVAAWMGPVMDQARRNDNRLIFSHLLSLVFSSTVNESVRQILHGAFHELDMRYAEVMHQIRPDLPRALIEWRMLASIGTFSLMLGHPELITLVRDEPLKAPQAEIDRHAELLRILTAQIGAPAPGVTPVHTKEAK